MNIISLLKIFSKFSEVKAFEFYPPFWFMGVKIKKITDDYRQIDVTVPIRWYAKNAHGSLFGGFLCAVSDPLAALLCGKIFPGSEVWTKEHHIDFLRPAKSRLHLSVIVTQEHVDLIEKELNEKGQCQPVFESYFLDEKDKKIAKVINTVFIRRK